MRKGILIFWLVSFLFLNSSFLLSNPKQREIKLNKSEELKREIRVLNLLNGLELTFEQMEMILRKAEESKKLRQDFETALYFREGEIERELEEIKTYLQDNRELPPSTIQRFHRLETEIKEEKFRIEKEIKEKVKEIKEILNEHQIYQLQKFIPCIIPPKGELRIGQTQDYHGLTRGIERIRQLPYRFYERKKDKIVIRTLEKMQLHVPRGVEIDDREMKRHISSVFAKARSLDEAEFEIQKERLAKELISPLKPQDLHNNLDWKIEALLVSPEIIPLLEKRIAKEIRTGGLKD